MLHPDFLSRNYFSSLDGIRCFSILAVLWHHSRGINPSDNPIFFRGYLGVDLFFVLSGFLITTILIREKVNSGDISLKKFYIRRSLRIFPIYYAYLGALLVLYAMTKSAEELRGYLDVLPMYALYLTNWIPEHVDHDFKRAWSLAVEEQFYLVWPVLIMTLGIRKGFFTALTLVILVTLTAMFFFDGWIKQLTRELIPFRTIMLGCILAILLNNPKSYHWLSRLLGNSWSVIVVCLSLLFSLLYITGPLPAYIELFVHLMMFALVGSVVLNENHKLKWVMNTKLVQKFGLVSYGIYIFHGQFGGITRYIVSFIPAPVVSESRVTFFIVFSLISFAVALASYYLFEMRFLNLKKKLAP